MADENIAPQEGQVETVEQGVAGSPRRTQTGYRSARATSKEQAAVTMKKDAEKALARKKKAQAQAVPIEGLKEFNEKAAEVEREIAERRKAREGTE